MTLLSFEDYRQSQPIRQIMQDNPGSYDQYVNKNNLDPNRDHLPKYTQALISYKIGCVAILKENNQN